MSAQTLVNLPSLIFNTEISLDDLIVQVDDFIIKSVSSSEETEPSTINAAECATLYHLATPGHKVRARLCLTACLELKVKYDDMLIISAVSELLHNASLIHDDIQDMDEVRRGSQTVWKKFGTNVAICAGDLLLSTAYGVLAGISETKLLPKLISIISRRTSAVIKGQCDDIEYKNKPINSVSNYVNIAIAKSGALLGLPIELALILSARDDLLSTAKSAVNAFAVGYQMVDDLNDIEKDSASGGRSKSLNIVFVLTDSGSAQPIKDAIALAEQSLSDAIELSRKLPNLIGEQLINLANQLQGKIKYESRS
jgi:geranylgeranyl diphosphate synthase type II